MSILRYLGLEGHAPPVASADTDSLRKIIAALDRLDPERARYIAAFAFVLGCVAYADLEISDVETNAMERLVMQHGGLPEEQAILVVEIAKTQNKLFGATENYLVTREFEKIATREQKLALIECLFAVAAADESISAKEDGEIHQIAAELKIEHEDLIAIRSGYRKYLEVFKI
jgi:uncharacterized tellurite resistance protein B-like protein